MKKYIMLIVLIILLFSCKSKFNNESTEEKAPLDEEHTDSFSPKSWETPINRKYVNFGDSDIGEVVQKSSIEPKLHNIYSTTERFFYLVSNSKLDELKSILIPSAYNSFILRFNGISFIDPYELRIAKPKNIEDNTFSLKIKLIFEEKNIIGTIGYQFDDDKCFIYDFDDKLFYDIMSSTTLRKQINTKDESSDTSNDII